MADETGRDIEDGGFIRGMREGWGMGESLARDLDARGDLANPELSILLSRTGWASYTCTRRWARKSSTSTPPPTGRHRRHSHRDFRRLSAALAGLDDGGVVMNVGSAVMMPEVFLKALTVARNLPRGPRGFTTCDLDMNRHYRPRMNVVRAPRAPAEDAGTPSRGTTRSWCRCWPGRWRAGWGEGVKG